MRRKMSFDERRNKFFQDYVAIQFDECRAFHADSSARATTGPARTEIFRPASAEFIWRSWSGEGWWSAKDGAEEHHRFARRRKILWARPESLPQIGELFRDWCGLHLSGSDVDLIVISRRAGVDTNEADRTNQAWIGRTLGPGLEPFKNRLWIFRKAITDLKCDGDPRQFTIEVGGK